MKLEVRRRPSNPERIARWTACFLALALLAPAAARAADAPAGARGTILCEFWKDLPGGDVDDLMNNPAFPARPTSVTRVSAFELPDKGADNWGVALRGFIYPPATGDYTFWIACDDGGTVYLSTDETTDRRQEICSTAAWTAFRGWDQFPSQKSKPIPLTAGKRYYVEAFCKNATGQGHLSVGWQLPDGKTERPIPGTRLSPANGPTRKLPSVPTMVTLDPALPAAATAGFHKFPRGSTVARGPNEFKMSYLMFMPKGYEASADKKPLFIFLCGNTHQGEDLNGILNEGPANYLQDNVKLREWFPMVGLFPQPPGNMRWDSQGMAQAVVGLIDEVCKKYPRIDRDRVYLSGLSMGGKGTWLVSQAGPDRFAAIAPISAVAVDPDHAGVTLKNVPTWIICGADDGGFTEGSKQMARALQQAGDGVQLTVVPNEGHGVWGRYYPDPKFYEKLMQFKKKPQPGKGN